jgi:hypothetical protein
MANDGSANAPAGSPQLPNLLSGEAVRPPWEVAGVDYAVGYSSGTVLKDPATISMPGVSVDPSTRTVFVTGNNVTLDGYDFSLHGGYQVAVSGANVTISDSNFVLGTNTGGYLIWGDSTATNLTIKYCTMDASTIGNETSLIGWGGSGTITLEYNWFENFPQHVLENFQPSGTTFSVVYKYNLIEQGAIESGAHLNFLQFGSGTVTSADVSYNTTYQTPQVSSGEGFQFYMNNSGTITNASLANNTMIAIGAKDAMAFMNHLGSNSQFPSPASGTVTNNYFDTSASLGAFYLGLSGFTYSGNIDMKSGKLILGNNVRVNPR